MNSLQVIFPERFLRIRLGALHQVRNALVQHLGEALLLVVRRNDNGEIQRRRIIHRRKLLICPTMVHQRDFYSVKGSKNTVSDSCTVCFFCRSDLIIGESTHTVNAHYGTNPPSLRTMIHTKRTPTIPSTFQCNPVQCTNEEHGERIQKERMEIQYEFAIIFRKVEEHVSDSN